MFARAVRKCMTYWEMFLFKVHLRGGRGGGGGRQGVLLC